MGKIIKRQDLKVVQHKRGRRRFGDVVVWPDGRAAYIGRRSLRNIYRHGEANIIVADKAGVACWSFDVDTFTFARSHKVCAIGVRVKETGDIYLASMADLVDVVREKVFFAHGWRHLPLKHFLMKRGRSAI